MTRVGKGGGGGASLLVTTTPETLSIRAGRRPATMKSASSPSMKSGFTPKAAAIASRRTLLYDSRNCTPPSTLRSGHPAPVVSHLSRLVHLQWQSCQGTPAPSYMPRPQLRNCTGTKAGQT